MLTFFFACWIPCSLTVVLGCLFLGTNSAPPAFTQLLQVSPKAAQRDLQEVGWWGSRTQCVDVLVLQHFVSVAAWSMGWRRRSSFGDSVWQPDGLQNMRGDKVREISQLWMRSGWSGWTILDLGASLHSCRVCFLHCCWACTWWLITAPRSLC